MYRFPSRARFDRQRDEYLTIKKGYEVVRIELLDRSTEDVAKLVRAALVARREKLADIEIQQLYMKVRPHCP